MTKKFLLPDLGEGLPDATIVEWHVKEGDVIRLDENLVSMETAKAVVDVPSPVSGKIIKLAGAAGDVIITGKLLVEFEIDPSLPQRAEGQDTGHHHGGHDEPEPAPAPAAPAKAEKEDAGTVVGAMQVGNAVITEAAVASGGVKAVPAVRATARKLGVDLSRVRPTGPDGTVTMNDVKQAAANPASLSAAPVAAAPAAAAAVTVAAPVAATRSTLSQAGKPMRTTPPGAAPATGQPEQLKGVRRNMARVMADARDRVVQTTIVDDADLHAWLGKQDITGRLIRAIVTACKAEPSLNAWFDDENLSLTKHPHVDLGIAVDTPDGLFVPALRNAHLLDGAGLRQGINRLRTQVEDRSIPASELSGYTISLSNFGVFAGRYGTVVVVPPCVAIIGAGKLSHDVVAVMGGIEVHRRLPISLTFDHRAITGGEAARFLRALLDDLALPQ
ncbi:MAG: 2-oxo acid dehydrogenase subunit E2 [Thermomonas sp.]|uniref:dihydrolipoamide acetyltransferase family protein n=1 Tax=Thermomonas sp. TaxID=1971895 RepID=UPI001EC83660|nr:dihydrolipoamide acetyltransferase family protein [Thermomonas sp.]MBV2208631.1 2-oxo acid dehydrogenase subunit E2 [Thermomonas sp.]